jgi:hypothetical protein
VPGTSGLQERIAALMERGVSLDQVEENVIEPSPLDPDQKAALWLYAWSFVDTHSQREEAVAYLRQLDPSYG